MSKVFEYMKPYTLMIIAAVVLLFIEVQAQLIIPGHMADIINDGVMPGNIPVIWRAGGQMVLLTLLTGICSLTMQFFAARTATGVANDLRAAVFKKVIHFSNAEMNQFSTASLITRTTNDITQIQTIIMMGMRLFVYAPLLAIGGIIRALDRSTSMAWIVGVAVIVMVAILAAMIIIVMPKFKKVQGLIDNLNLVSRENLSGILIVRAFSTQKFERERFDEANKSLASLNMFVDQAFAPLMPTIMFIMNITMVAIIWIGAQQASAFRVDIGDMFAFMQYGILIIVGFLMVAIMFVFLPRAMVSAGRIKEVLETESSLIYKEDPIPLSKDINATVEFKNVTFRYPDAREEDEEVLKNISFKAEPGKTTAIIGSTGAGKSTILQLLLRFYDATGGSVHVGGVDIKDVKKADLHNIIGYVPQKAHLFSGNIKSNLLYADKNASDERLKIAADIAQATPFIENMEDKYESNVAQGGTNFSGGQRQRLSIARALVKNAPIYLFDDSFSALDLKTDALLRTALKKNTGNSTMIIIAQRISTIMDADQIVVLDHGEVVGLGTHFELMSNCEVYREIAASQLSEEELGGAV